MAEWIQKASYFLTDMSLKAHSNRDPTPWPSGRYTCCVSLDACSDNPQWPDTGSEIEP